MFKEAKEGQVICEKLVLVTDVAEKVASKNQNLIFCIVTVRDSSTTISFTVFKTTKQALKEKGVYPGRILLLIRALVGSYQGNLQLNDVTYSLSEGDPFDYLPALTARELEHYKHVYDTIVLQSTGVGSHWRSLLEMFKEKYFEQFCRATAAVGNHSAYVGGLLVHSISVAKIAVAISKSLKERESLVATAALLHDVGKINTITAAGGFKMSPIGASVEHVAEGVFIVRGLIDAVRAKGVDFPQADQVDLEHLIASHPGKLEYGALKEPAIPEAFTLSHADMRAYEKEVYEEGTVGIGPGESVYVRGLARYVYVPHPDIMEKNGY